MTISEELAQFITGLSYEDLPEDVVASTKRYLIDTMGAALSGAISVQAQAMESFLGEIAGTEEATVIGTRHRTSRLDAALANGVIIRARELEEDDDVSSMHSAPGSIGGTLALIEHHRPTGRELLTAIALGYEVAIRIARSVSPSHALKGYHATGTCGSFGATAATGKLMGLSESQMVAALGIAGLQAAGVSQTPEPAWRYLTGIDGGRAAHLGMTAALLARSGFPGSPQILEAPYGFCAMHADSYDLSMITRGLGTDYVMPNVGMKLYPASRTTHAVISAGILLKNEHDIDPEAIESVEVRGIAISMVHGNKPHPHTELEAQGSQQYTMSVALTRGNFTLEDVTMKALQDPDIERLMAKFTVIADPEKDEERIRRPGTWPMEAKVRMNDGTTYTQSVDFPPGTVSNPATPQQLEDKYIAVTSGVLPERQARELWDIVDRLDLENDLASFVRLWQPPPSG